MSEKKIAVNTVVIAGGRPFMGHPCKAVLPFMGRPMIQYVVDALLASGVVGKIVVVGPVEPLSAALPDYPVEFPGDAGTMLDNLALGLSHLPQDEMAAHCAADSPLLTPAAIREIYTAGIESGCEATYSFVEKNDMEREYPGCQRTYLRLKTGRMTGCNLGLIHPQAFVKARPKLNLFIENRKKPMKIARIIGLGLILRVLLGTLSPVFCEKKAQQILDVNLFAHQSRFPCTAQDIDRESDLPLMEGYARAQEES